jgi:thioesterase domain-containing protein/acyl carrier protein
LAHFLHWQRSTFDVGPTDRVGQLTSYSFDVIFRDLFLPLTSGATLCLTEPGNAFDGESVLSWLEWEKISVLHCVPSLAQSWLSAIPDRVTLSNLRIVFFAGEPLSRELVERWREAFPASGEIVNLYGPSETTLAKAFYRIPKQMSPGVQPIGWALSETQLLILSHSGLQCGIGEAGEIAIRTPFRSHGYVNNPIEQAEHFVPNHLAHADHHLLYLTGDLGRYRFDGAVEIHGRKDHQIKVRGVRIEPGEIETTLRRHERVQECLVTVFTDDYGDKHLVAYVVSQGLPITVSELRGYLERELPLYMIPSFFVLLEKLPLTANGKVDRRSLPFPDQSRPSLTNGYAGPTDVLELQLVQVWEELLGVQPIGITDNFFDLGGHSLMTIRLMNMLEKQFGQKLPLAVIFQGSTIKHLAHLLRGKVDLRRRSPLVVIQPKGTGPAFYCVHPAGGNVVCYTDLAREMGTDRPFYGLQTPGYEGEREPLTNFEELASCYVQAIREHQSQGPYLIGGWSLGAVLAFEMARQFELQGQRVALLAMFDHKAPLSLDHKPRERDDVTLLLQACGDELVLPSGELQAVQPQDQLAFIVAKAKEAGMMPDDITVAQVQSYIHVYKANVRALRLYSPKPYRGAITLFRTGESLSDDTLDITMGWQQLALGGVEVHRVSGRHNNMVRGTYAVGLAKTLNECLQQAMKQ